MPIMGIDGRLLPTGELRRGEIGNVKSARSGFPAISRWHLVSGRIGVYLY